MKSKSVLVTLAIIFFLFAVATSVVIWSDVSSAAKIAFFAFGYGSGVTTGLWMAGRQQIVTHLPS
jgi:glycerol uptake facilitator-like aquaporin